MMMHDSPHGGSPASHGGMQMLPWVPRASTCVAMESIRALTFDATEELLWVCDSYGTARSFQSQLTPDLSALDWYAYSAFTYHGSPCIAAVSTPELLWTASSDWIRGQKRGGASVHRIYVAPTIQRRIANIVVDRRTDSVLFHGETPGIMQCFYETGNDIGVIPTELLMTCMVMTEPYLITGTAVGEVVLRDPRSFAPSTRLRTDNRVMDVQLGDDQNSLLVVGGNHVRLYDVRQPNQPVSRIATQSNLHKLLRLGPTEYLGGGPVGIECFNIGPQGVLGSSYSLDLTGNGLCTTFALSENSECLCVGTDKGIVHALSALHTVTVDNATQTIQGPFRNTPRETQPQQPTSNTIAKWAAANDTEEKMLEQGFDWNYDGELASDWPAPHHMILAVEGKPPVIPQHLRDIAQTPIENRVGASRVDTFRPNPKDKLNQFIPNPWPFNEQLGTDPTRVAQQLVELRKQRKNQRTNKSGNLAYSKLEEALQVCYPSHNQPFDWKSVNQSRDLLIGLDNSLPESWINAMLHCIFYLQAPNFVIRKTLMRHVCKKNLCLACDVAALFSNMTIQQQNHAQPIMQPTNLLRTVRQIPEFVKAKVFTPAVDRDDQVAKCHTFTKIFLELLDSELRLCGGNAGRSDSISGIPGDFIASVFGTELQLTQSKTGIAPRFYWEVPASASKVDEGLQHLLKQLERYRGEAVSIRNLPPVLMLLLNPEHGHLRPPPSLKFSRPNEEYNYVLTSNIIHLAEDADDPGTFVLHAKLPDSSLRAEPGKIAESWVVMNDYCISSSVPTEDMLESLMPTSVNHSTVVTCYVLDKYRQHRLRDERFDLFSAAGSVLMDDWSRRELILQRPHALPPPRMAPSLTVLPELRNISQSDIIAIDAEYIQLVWGNEIRGDEPEWVLNQRKAFMSLARVSCVLSREPGDERTIIDDYIATNEEVRDYVTKYSGIHPGDLDINKTPYALTTLKTAVLKLRCLVDRGVRFLGHGLSQDFRVINLAVPKYRTIDTLELFHRKGHRYLSLRFLAYHVLEERVQDDEHDSIIDARTSLRLFRKYNELIAEGRFESTMDRLYEIGAETNFYVPDPDDDSATPTPQTILSVRVDEDGTGTATGGEPTGVAKDGSDNVDETTATSTANPTPGAEMESTPGIESPAFPATPPTEQQQQQ